METTTSDELEALVQSELAAGGYANRDALLIAALRALREEREHMREFREQLEKRIDEVDRGEGIVLEDEAAMRSYMNGLDRKFAIKYGLDPDSV
jgi:Arc/MetJ-type ribon-helix-helix transcriptional regulator